MQHTGIAEQALVTLTIPGYADFLAAEGRDVWMTNEGRVEKLSVGSPTPVATVAVPAPCGGMVVAFGALWVANLTDCSMYRIDLETRAVASIIATGLADPEGELSLAAGAGSVWLLSDVSGILSRVDPATNTVVSRIEVRPNSFAADFGFGAVWITNSGSVDSAGSVQRIDPHTNQVTATIPVGPTPRFLAAGEGGVWTLNQGDGSVTRIDPTTNQVVSSIEVGMSGGGGDIAAGGGRVWVRGKSVLLASINAQTNQVEATYGPPAGSGAVRVAEDLVWVTAHDTRTVWVLRPDSRTIASSIGTSGSRTPFRGRQR